MQRPQHVWIGEPVRERRDLAARVEQHHRRIVDRARTYMEDALRMTVHLLMSTPEYQIV
jgi:hypothetical protein